MKRLWIIMMGSLLMLPLGVDLSRGAAKLPSRRSRLAHPLCQVIPPGQGE